MEYKKFSDEQLDRAKNADIISFLSGYYGLEFKRAGKYYQCKQHNSLVVYADRKGFVWNSRNISGGDAIDFLRKVEGKAFPEAVETIIGEGAAVIYTPAPKYKIADLRKVGEEQYGIKWEESLYVRNKGSEYGSKYGGCGYFPPVSTQDVAQGNGKALRQDCIDSFEYLKAQHPAEFPYVSFKIVVEDIGDKPYKYYGDGRIEYEHVYWIYLLYT